MSIKKTLGGDRLGAGKKMQVELHGFERSTHDLSYLWRSTMSSGTLVPFMSEVALPGDTFDIDLNCVVKTHPTVAPLFGSFKVQLDLFLAPMRLYHSALHNNQLGIGLNMSQIKLPTITYKALQFTGNENSDLDNSQINSSALPSYLGIRGIGSTGATSFANRSFNAIPTLAYWEIYKNYYANKQEEIGAVIHTPQDVAVGAISNIQYNGNVIPEFPDPQVAITIGASTELLLGVQYTVLPNPESIQFNTNLGLVNLSALFILPGFDAGGTLEFAAKPNAEGITIYSWQMTNASSPSQLPPEVVTFPLSEIDDMRHKILSHYVPGTDFNINTDAPTLRPYKWLYEQPNGLPNILSSQEGLGIKTYQSDLFNNWLQTEWIDGVGGINDITAIDTSGGSFNIDTLLLSKKVYDMLNRIAVSGGSYDDWLDAVWAHDRYTRAETPIYCGGLSKELVFQEVVSNSAGDGQALGTLAGKGVMSDKHKGGHVIIKADEPGYIIGIISLTPRLDYSQGNKWDTTLYSLDDLHKPNLDEIGFQELITEQMAWWSTEWNAGDSQWVRKSAGKQPAWINYMTNVNQVRGNFANESEGFMVLNRKYTPEDSFGGDILDLTTYIDPSKFNNIFADTALDAQNFWTQIAVNITARRKMSAKVMPNL